MGIAQLGEIVYVDFLTGAPIIVYCGRGGGRSGDLLIIFISRPNFNLKRTQLQ